MNKKVIKKLTPIIAVASLASIAPFVVTSCGNKKADKQVETIKLNLDASPNDVATQASVTPFTITNNSETTIYVRTRTTGSEAFEYSHGCFYRRGQGDNWFPDGWNAFGGSFHGYVDSEPVAILPHWSLQMGFNWHDEALGNFSSETNKLHILIDTRGDNTPISINGSLMSFTAQFSGSQITPTIVGSTKITSDYAFSELFSECNDVKFTVSSNLLPFKTLKPHCYDSMFKGCAGLMNVPALPATNLPEGCYQNMFFGCTSIETTGNLPAYILANNCYTNMFYNCSNLKMVSLGYVGNFYEKFFKDWLKNAGSNVSSGIARYNGLDNDTSDYALPEKFKVIQDNNLIANHTKTITLADDGTTSTVTGTKKELRVYSDNNTLTFGQIKNQLTEYGPKVAGNTFIAWYDSDKTTKLEDLTDDYLVKNLVSSGNRTIVPKYGADESEPIAPGSVNLVVVEDTTVTLNEVGTDQDASRFAYRVWSDKANDWGTWNLLAPGTTYDFYAGLSVQIIGVSQSTGLETNYTNLKISGGKVKLRGDIKSFCCTNTDDKEAIDSWVIPDSLNTLPCDYCFASLFKGSDAIISVDPGFLPAMNLTNFCYARMFEGCTNLSLAPEMPAKTAAGGCYYSMFKESGVVTVPKLDLETLAEPAKCNAYGVQVQKGNLIECYKGVCDLMFYKCSKLTSVPDLKPTIVTDRAYNMMFEDCSSLVNIPKLYATEIKQSNYHSDDGTAENKVSGKSEDYKGACNSMFRSTAVVDASGVWATGTAPSVGRAGIYQMFGECKQLIKIPSLSTTLTDKCYYKLFYSCSKLKVYNGEPASGQYKQFFISPDTLPTNSVANMIAGTANITSIAANTSYYYGWTE